MTTIKLTDTQTEVLKVAAYRVDGNIEPLPPTLRGGARTKVIEGLLARRMISRVAAPEGDAYVLTDAAYAAVGRKRPGPEIPNDPEIEAAISSAEEQWRAKKQAAAKRLLKVGVEGQPRTRENNKQAQVLAMLGRPEGATVKQIMAATGWLAHTVRGTFAGAFKKKLGLNLVSEKTPDGRVYRLA